MTTSPSFSRSLCSTLPCLSIHPRMNCLCCCLLLLSQCSRAFAFSVGRRTSVSRHHLAPQARTFGLRQAPVSLFATSKDDQDTESKANGSSSLTSEIAEVAPQLEATPVGRDVLLPLAQVLEDSTDGWALEYADLAPETESTPVGISFLATNAAYTLCGLLLVQNGNVLLGILTELASVASFAYHYTQLKLGKNQPLVRVALLVDYVVAAATLFAALVYILRVGIWNVPWQGVVASILAVVFLFLSWVWEKGLPYVINHGLWHLLGAYAGFIIGQAHYADSITS